MPQRGYVSQPRVGRGTRPTLGSMLERISTPTGLCPAGEAVDGGTQPPWGRGHAGVRVPGVAPKTVQPRAVLRNPVGVSVIASLMRLPAYPGNTGNLVEMGIAAENWQFVLAGNGCDPEIVHRNGCACGCELESDLRIVASGGFVSYQNHGGGERIIQPCHQLFIARSLLFAGCP